MDYLKSTKTHSFLTYCLILHFSDLSVIQTSFLHPFSTLVNTISAVKNSKNFVDFISLQQLDNEVIIFYDVVSLFTNIPTDLAIQIARKWLEADDTLEDRTQLEVDYSAL